MWEAFGLDLAGYSTGKSSLAGVSANGASVEATIFRGHAFADKHDGDRALTGFVPREQELVEACTRKKLFVDVPIDLQDLPRPRNPAKAWELTKRPVDRLYSALSPLANRLGAPCARFLNILGTMDQDLLGRSLFETYPAASLRSILGKKPKYKNSTIRSNGSGWEPDAGPGADGLVKIATRLRMTGPENMALTDDDVDAIVCALVGVASADERIERDAIQESLKTLGMGYLPPSGYTLLGAWNRIIRVEELPRMSHSELLQRLSE